MAVGNCRAGDGGRCRKRRRRLVQLTDTQLIILSKTAARDDGAATIPGNLNKANAAIGNAFDLHFRPRKTGALALDQ
jgi:hypothetical protein